VSGPAVTARAGTNIALVKYWGKRDAALNLPATGSLSLTLAELGTVTRVRFLDGELADRVWLDDIAADAAFARRVTDFLDLVRQRGGIKAAAEVFTHNSVPTASGLASSASGFAALSLAAARAADLALGTTSCRRWRGGDRDRRRAPSTEGSWRWHRGGKPTGRTRSPGRCWARTDGTCAWWWR
jgi:diphosphomevalonate decarboxylase